MEVVKNTPLSSDDDKRLYSFRKAKSHTYGTSFGKLWKE